LQAAEDQADAELTGHTLALVAVAQDNLLKDG
jgi:hypothetical protein